MEEEKEKKIGRRKKERKQYIVNREQTKFFVDLSKDRKSLEMVFNQLEQVNKKRFRRRDYI